MTAMTIGELIVKLDNELDNRYPNRFDAVCKCCGEVFVCYKPVDSVTGDEVCGMDDCSSGESFSELDFN